MVFTPVVKYKVLKEGVDITQYVSSVEVSKQLNEIVDNATLYIPFDYISAANVSVGDEVLIKLISNNGEERNFFIGYVFSTSRFDKLVVKVYSYEARLKTIKVKEIYNNMKVTDIIKSLILVYAPFLIPRVEDNDAVLEKYVCNGYLYDTLIQLCEAVGYKFYVDFDKNFVCKLFEGQPTNYTFEAGKDFTYGTFDRDMSFVVNSVRVIGGNVSVDKTETFTANSGQTTFILTYSPTTVDITVDGVEKSHEDFSVYPEEKKVVFNSPLNGGENVVIKYSYVVPIVVTKQNLSSIGKYGERHKDIVNQAIKTKEDALVFVDNYLSVHSEPPITASYKGNVVYFELDEGQNIHVIDPLENFDGTLVISKYKIRLPESYSEIIFGSLNKTFAEYLTEAQRKLNELTRASTMDSKFETNVNTMLSKFKIIF